MDLGGKFGKSLWRRAFLKMMVAGFISWCRGSDLVPFLLLPVIQQPRRSRGGKVVMRVFFSFGNAKTLT
jgi:hypothetical protein